MWCKEKAREAGATLLNIHADANEEDTKKKQKKKNCTLHFSHRLMTQVCLRLAVCNKPTLRSIPAAVHKGNVTLLCLCDIILAHNSLLYNMQSLHKNSRGCSSRKTLLLISFGFRQPICPKAL